MVKNSIIKKFSGTKNYFLFSFLPIISILFFDNVAKIYQPFSSSFLAQILPTEINFFRASPRLTRTVTTFNATDVISTYIFEILIPENAGNGLQKIIINQQPNTETIDFFPEETKLFIIQPQEKLIPIQAFLSNENQDNKIIINLLEPIPAGTKLRLKIQARNPLYAGIYQFGVTVFPQGNNPRSLYLGIARFHFYRGGSWF